MIRHYIIMSSSYTDGKRIALDITEESLLNADSIETIVGDIRNNCDDDVPLSTHYIQTKDKTWQSVEEYDPFFENVECTRSVEEFAQKIKIDRVIKGLDVANYIASKILCTHLKLEKLVYLAYADYLCKYHSKLFEDQIYAFTHGPVVNSVYEMFKRSGASYVDPQDYDGEMQKTVYVKEMPAKSRILFAKHGVEKIQSIDQTISNYGELTAGQLVDLTHRDGSPWSRVDSSRAYQLISDSLIERYHSVEIQ